MIDFVRQWLRGPSDAEQRLARYNAELVSLRVIWWTAQRRKRGKLRLVPRGTSR